MSELAIRNVDDLITMARTLAVSALLPGSLRGKPADVMIVLLYGAELGISPGQSLRGIHAIDGRAELSAQLWNALTRRAGHDVEVVEHTAQGCTVKVTRGDNGKSHTSSFTLDQAVQMGKVQIKDGKPFARSTTGKPLPWETATLDMLLARAISRCCRFLVPEVALGFYSEGELPEEEPETVTAVSEVIRPADAPSQPGDTSDTQAELGEIVAEFQESTP